MFLSPEELAELTRKTQHRAQKRVLDALGVTSRVRPDGSLVVSRAHVEEVLGTKNGAKVHEIEPNWEAARA